MTSPTSSFDTLISEKAREIRRGFRYLPDSLPPRLTGSPSSRPPPGRPETDRRKSGDMVSRAVGQADTFLSQIHR